MLTAVTAAHTEGAQTRERALWLFGFSTKFVILVLGASEVGIRDLVRVFRKLFAKAHKLYGGATPLMAQDCRLVCVLDALQVLDVNVNCWFGTRGIIPFENVVF
jgi:hypothetical protein